MQPTMQDIVRQFLYAIGYPDLSADQLARALVDHFAIGFKETSA